MYYLFFPGNFGLVCTLARTDDTDPSMIKYDESSSIYSIDSQSSIYIIPGSPKGPESHKADERQCQG